MNIQIQVSDNKVRAIILEGEFGNAFSTISDIFESNNSKNVAEWIASSYPSLRIWTNLGAVTELNISKISLKEELELLKENNL